MMNCISLGNKEYFIVIVIVIVIENAISSPIKSLWKLQRQWLQLFSLNGAKPSIHSSAPGKFAWSFRQVIFLTDLAIDGWGISCEFALIWNVDPDLCRHMASLGQKEF